MKLKSKLLAGSGALLMAGGMLSIAAPAAQAAVTPMGGCGDSVSLVKLASATKGVGLTDQTGYVKISGGLAKDQTTKAIVNGGGTCTGTTRQGDTHVPFTPGGLTLNAVSQATALSGNSSCANGATAQAADATASQAYPLTGKITWKFAQTYTDLITLGPKNYKMQAAISLLGFDTVQPDVVNLGGIVLSGVNAGATVGGNIWEDPVSKTGGATGYNTGYELDLASAAGCADGTANNANLTIVLSGSGGSTPSLLGSTAGGLTFQAGQP